MNIQLIDGEFKPKDAMDLITQMLHIKIKYHENKLRLSKSQEEIKVRELKIKGLKKDLFELGTIINYNSSSVKINSIIEIT